MKKFLMILMVSAIAIFLATGSALAVSISVVPDDINYWPGFPDTYGDSIGTPLVGDMTIYTENNHLLQVDIAIESRRVKDWLFINLGGAWDSWDRVVVDETKYEEYDNSTLVDDGAKMYSVPMAYEYIYPGTLGSRESHPSGLKVLGAETGGVDVIYSNNLLTYTFDNPLQILTGEGDWPALGYTQYCANDVHLAQIPEPATMLLLGTGLIGLAFLGRKKLFKK